MALEKPSRGRFWSRLHFLVRFAGLTGLIVAFVGLTIALVDGALIWSILWLTWDQLLALLQGQEVVEAPRLGIVLLLGGLVAGLFTLVVEMLVVLRLAAGRRSAFGFNAALQVGLAVVLILGLNLFSFLHYRRVDLTGKFVLPSETEEGQRLALSWHEKFTLPQELQENLVKLQGETTIVVCQREKAFGRLSSKPDAYEYAANRKVVEKVKDLVEQFREFGPQFKVEVLDVEADDYGSQFNQVTKSLAEAAVASKGESTEPGPEGTPNEAVEKKTREFRRLFRRVPENTIFFVSGDQVQHLAFSEFYQLDKVASRKLGQQKERKGEEDEENENQPGSNLVLLYQGPEPFARKALNIDQKRPRVGIATIHELLSTEGSNEFGHQGLKKCLRDNGFEVRDIMLKRNRAAGSWEPAVYTYEESRYETLEEEIAVLDGQLKVLETNLPRIRKFLKRWQTESLEELHKDVADQLGDQKLTERMRREHVEIVKQALAVRERQLNGIREEREAKVKEKAGLNVDRLQEQRRLLDLKVKLDRQLADVDLLILPRTTFLKLTIGWRIPSELHDLDKAQIASVRDFLKAGKPVLACFGPINEQGQGRNASPTTKPDGLEELLSELGIRFGKSAVLFDVEAKAFGSQRSGLQAVGLNIDVPSVDFDWSAKGLWLPGMLSRIDEPPLPPNPLRHAMKIAQHGALGRLNLPPLYPRPMGVDPEVRKRLSFEPEIMVTSADSWNDPNPFPTAERVPHFEEPKENDSRKDTLDALRRGPFAIGVALETTLPASWYEESMAQPASVRVAALGDGAILVGRDLTPARERFLLNTCNWLLGRDDALPRDDQPWSFPRVEMEPREQRLWMLAALFGLPGLFAYLGFVVLLVRRLR